MSLPKVCHALADLGSLNLPVHLAIGMFDGVHKGHARVLASSMDSAREDESMAVVLSFPNHPSRLLRPESPTPLLMSPEAKTSALLAIGLDHVVLQPFDIPFSQIEASAFVTHLQNDLPVLESVSVGGNFHFGRGREGDSDALVALASELGVEVHVVPPVRYLDEPISSSRIRERLAQGEITLVNDMLGRRYEASGTIQSGDGRGEELGFPTLNLPWNPEAKPCFGVYAVELTHASSESSFPGVANYGVRPTFDQAEESPLLETHLFDRTQLKPGDFIRVSFVSFLREEHKFDSVEELKKQIAQDKETARLDLSL